MAALCALGRPAAGQTIGEAAIQAIVDERVTSARAVGLVVATLDRGKTRVYTAGSSGAEGVKLDGNTVFEIGSITKVFTAALQADMVARG